MSGAGLDSLAGGTAVVFMALLFARALVHKLADVTAFGGFLADYGILPPSLVRPAAVAVLVAEGLVIATLLVPAAWTVGSLLAAALLAVYGLAIAHAVRSGRRWIECGCGGAMQPVSWPLVARNALLAAVALLGTAGAGGSLDTGEAVAVIAAGFAVFLGYMLADQILGNAAHAASRA